MPDVFLSYAREDQLLAEKLAALLAANGLDVWWDRRLAAGDEINDVIEAAIEQSKAVVVLWSPSSVGSRWVKGEAETAAEAGKLVPVKIAPCKLPIAFRGLHTPDVFASRQHIDDLAGMLTAKLRPGAPPEQKISISAESSGRFLADLRSVLTTPSASFTEQFSREWELGQRHPVIYWGGGLLAYVVCVLAAMNVLDLDFTAANAIVFIVALVVYFAYRRYRLSRTSV